MSTDQLFANQVGLAHNISSSTLRHASPQFSFPHSQRFTSLNQLTAPSKLELPSMLGHKTTTQGFGNKVLFQWKFQETKARTLPSPDRYETRTKPGADQLKRSFGVGFDAYLKTYLPHNKNIPDEVAKTLPGPGGYNVRQEMAQHKYQYSLKGKGKAFNDFRDWGFPGPDKYKPSSKITLPSRFLAISQGVGDKKDPFRSTSITPGPGRYTLPSAFEKSLRKKLAKTKSVTDTKE